MLERTQPEEVGVIYWGKRKLGDCKKLEIPDRSVLPYKVANRWGAWG